MFHIVTLSFPCPILELGCGPGSTPLLHKQALLGRLVVSADTNLSWCNTSAHKHKLHVFKQVDDPWTGWDKLFHDAEVARDDWSIVFVDQWPSALRPAAMRHFRYSSTCAARTELKIAGILPSHLRACRFVIMHDSSFHPTTISRFGYGHVEALQDNEDNVHYCNDYREELKSYHEFSARDPQSMRSLPDTLVGSMVRDVSAVVSHSGLESASLFQITEDL